MPYHRQVVAQLERLGKRAKVLARTETARDDFNNREFDWVEDREVPCLRSYPNRNVEEERTSGTIQGDRPVFIFPKANGNPNVPAPPSSEERIVYDGTTYTLESPTHYDTHIEVMGNKVDN